MVHFAYSMKEIKRLPAELEDAGLSEKASIVYACLLELGGAYPSQIAKETHLNRSTVYKILTDLSIKGLINEIERGKKMYYQVENPKKLLRFAERQAQSASDSVEKIQNLLPELQGYFASHNNRPRVLYFEGTDGVLSVYDDLVAGEDPYELLCFANSSNVIEFLDEKYYAKFRKRKAELGITVRGILPANDNSRTIVEDIHSDVPVRFRPKVRYLPAKDFPLEGEIIVYGDSKMLITNLDLHHPSGIIIEDKALHRMMRIIFNLAWNGAQESST